MGYGDRRGVHRDLHVVVRNPVLCCQAAQHGCVRMQIIVPLDYSRKNLHATAGSPLTSSVFLYNYTCAAGGKQLGSWLIGIVYVVFILSNQIAPSIVGMIGAKWTMVAGSVGYLLVVAGTASQNDHLTLIGGACVGFGAGLLWSGQGRMVTDLSTDSTRGFCWGIFDALMMGGSGCAPRQRALPACPPDPIGTPVFLNSSGNTGWLATRSRSTLHQAPKRRTQVTAHRAAPALAIASLTRKCARTSQFCASRCR